MQKNDIPEFLKEKLIKQYGNDTAKQIINSYFEKRKVTFRVNTLKSNIKEIEDVLKKENIIYKKNDFYENAFIIDEDESLIKRLDIFKSGKIYLQSLSSMLPAIILNPNMGEDILDMAAAPGGKTTQIAAITNNKANITACEINKIRAERLKYNINLQGARVLVLEKDARRIEDFFSFDKILLDAPCSGSGIIYAKDKKYKDFFTESLIEKSTKKQLELLRKAIKILKNDGEIVYSTCSILEEENENIIIKILQENKNIRLVPLNIDKHIPMLNTKLKEVACIMPSKEFEGFFVAKLKKCK